MKVAIVGSRDFADYEYLKSKLDTFLGIDLIISGGARGADSLAERYAKENNIETKIFLPDWNTYGKQAGFIRNRDIVHACDLLVAFWDGKSRGTQHSIDIAFKTSKKYKIYYFNKE